jgi:hypothetical protein
VVGDPSALAGLEVDEIHAVLFCAVECLLHAPMRDESAPDAPGDDEP